MDLPCLYATGSAADSSGLHVGDRMVHVNGQDIQKLSHVELVSVIKTVCQLTLAQHWNP